MSEHFSSSRARVILGAALLFAGASIGVAGCSLHHVEEAPAPELDVPERYAAAAASEERIESRDRWWLVFGDPELDRLVEHALADNLDLKRGWARLAQVEAVMRGAESAQLPQITAEAGLSGQRSVFNLGGPIGLVSNTSATYALALGARYEVDLWGRVAAAVNAAEVDVKATRHDIEAAAMTLSGRVTELWLAIAGEREGLALLDAQTAVTRDLLELVELRFGQGLASSLEVFQQRQQLVSLEAQRPLIEGRLASLHHQLALLLGRPPGTIPDVARAALPDAAPPPASGVPADLLAQRPDVRAAQMRVVAADHRVGAAIADRYPSLTLSGRIGFQAADLADLVESWIWSLAANLVAPLFDGGRRSAEVDRARAALEDVLHGYGQVVLQALVEVEDALALEARQREHIARLDEQLELARASLEEAKTRYVNGLTDYLSVLTTQRALQQAEQAHLAAERQLLAYRVQVHRALGGTWTRTLTPSTAQRDGGAP